jgi:hypothetical protein
MAKSNKANKSKSKVSALKTKRQPVDTLDKITSQKQKIARFERSLSIQKIKERKADTRRKIEFGGLIIKAKMDNFSKSVILGALRDALENIQHDENHKKIYQSKGEASFMGFD